MKGSTISIEHLKNFKVSYYKNMKNTVSTEKPLMDVLGWFNSDVFKSKVEPARLLYQENYDEYCILKSKLPAIAFCGEFKGGHRKDCMNVYNFLLIIDIDKLTDEDMIRIKNCLLNDDYVFSYWESPSGKGIKGLISLSYNISIMFEDISHYHTYAFREIRDYFKANHNIELDQSGSDTSRLCFVTYDPQMVLKDCFKQYQIDVSNIENLPLLRVNERKEKTKANISIKKFESRHKNSEGKNCKDDRLLLARIIKFLAKHNLSITKSYDDWFRVGLAIANTFSSDIGEELYLKLCRLDGVRHDEVASREMLIDCYNCTRGFVNFSTIVFLAKKQGYMHNIRGGSKGG